MPEGAAMIPPKEKLTICFAHVAYQFRQRFLARQTGIKSFEVRDRAELDRRIGEVDVLVVSGLWRNDLPELAANGIRLASAQGVNARAVSEHAIALILALSRRLPEARDNQAKHFWRGMIGDLTRREDELGGKTLLIVGLGRIGGCLAALAKA